jgi:RNA polymerase sigma factor (sigma-70 family)
MTAERRAPAPSFEAFFEGEYTRLARAVYLMTGDALESEDIAQEAMARLYERWDRVSQMESPVGYLFRTGLNLVRKRSRRARVRLRKPGSQPPVPSDPALVVEARSEIRRALSSLPANQREALILVEWLGMGAEEAGALMGARPGTVRVWVSRAKAGVRRQRGGTDE